MANRPSQIINRQLQQLPYFISPNKIMPITPTTIAIK